MNQRVDTRIKPTQSLSFDKVDAGTKPQNTNCASCKRAITETYFEVNGLVACPACHRQAMAMRTGGSGASRFARALMFGGAGAVAGALLWFAVASITGMEIGYIGIAVGFLVGIAVKKGSDARGGLVYQGLAVVLTYLAIVTTYMPDIAKGLDEQLNADAHATANPAAGAGHTPNARARESTVRGPGEQLLFGAVVFAVALAAPFLAGLGNLIGIAIIGFAVFQAWRINRREEWQVTGPLRVGAPPGSIRAA